MTILSGYGGCHEEDIMNMPEKELREAVIRAFSLTAYIPGDGWHGYFLSEDDIADAFRNRL